MNALDRVFEATECRTQVDLAAVLDIKQSSISDAKRRNSVPSEWLIKILRLTGVNPDWILDGVSPKYLIPSETPTSPHVIRIPEIRPPAACPPQDLINELLRRALQKTDFEEVQKQVMGTWYRINKEEDNS